MPQMVFGVVREFCRQIFSVVAYFIFRDVASAPAIAYVAIILTTVFASRHTMPCTLQGCNNILLKTTLQVSGSLLLYGVLGLYNLDAALQNDWW